MKILSYNFIVVISKKKYTNKIYMNICYKYNLK